MSETAGGKMSGALKVLGHVFLWVVVLLGVAALTKTLPVGFELQSELTILVAAVGYSVKLPLRHFGAAAAGAVLVAVPIDTAFIVFAQETDRLSMFESGLPSDAILSVAWGLMIVAVLSDLFRRRGHHELQ